MQLSQHFEGRAAMVTGGGSGFARAAAIRLKQEGAAIDLPA